jgi:hypothetical protein
MAENIHTSVAYQLKYLALSIPHACEPRPVCAERRVVVANQSHSLREVLDSNLLLGLSTLADTCNVDSQCELLRRV